MSAPAATRGSHRVVNEFGELLVTARTIGPSRNMSYTVRRRNLRNRTALSLVERPDLLEKYTELVSAPDQYRRKESAVRRVMLELVETVETEWMHTSASGATIHVKRRPPLEGRPAVARVASYLDATDREIARALSWLVVPGERPVRYGTEDHGDRVVTRYVIGDGRTFGDEKDRELAFRARWRFENNVASNATDRVLREAGAPWLEPR